jgi:CBS-domain-containing membrane protein
VLLRLVVIFAALCALAGVVLLVAARELEWALWIGGSGALVLLLTGLHCFNVAEGKLPKWARRPLNMHAD